MGELTGSPHGRVHPFAPIAPPLQTTNMTQSNMQLYRRSPSFSSDESAPAPPAQRGIVSVVPFLSSTVSMGFGYETAVYFECQTQFGDIPRRERDRPVRFSIRRYRWRTVLGWQLSTSAAPRTDAVRYARLRRTHQPSTTSPPLPYIGHAPAESSQHAQTEYAGSPVY